MIESLELNKNKLFNFKLFNFKNNLGLRIFTLMFIYSLIINLILLSIFFSSKNWLVITGFDLGFLGNVIGFCLLLLSGKWLTSQVAIKQALAYVLFFIRMAVYAGIILLAFFLHLANIPSVVGGFSLLLFTVVTSELFWFKNKEKKKKVA